MLGVVLTADRQAFVMVIYLLRLPMPDCEFPYLATPGVFSACGLSLLLFYAGAHNPAFNSCRLKECEGLRKLSLEGCVTLSGSSLHALEGLLVTDFTLSLGDYQEPGGNALQSLVSMPRLTRLVCKCWVAPNHEPGLFGVVQDLVGLQALVLHDAVHLTDDIVRRKLMQLTRLESLDIWGCHRVTTVGIRTLLGLTSLKSLEYSAHIGVPLDMNVKTWFMDKQCDGHLRLLKKP